MRGYMFRNRWGALLFVGITLAGVTTLVGTGGSDGAIQQAADQLANQKAEAERLTAPPEVNTPVAAEVPSDTVILAADEELIDPATGEDPTPVDEFAAANPADPEEPADTAVILSREVAPQPAQPPAPQQ
jgi:hypothetical protein